MHLTHVCCMFLLAGCIHAPYSCVLYVLAGRLCFMSPKLQQVYILALKHDLLKTCILNLNESLNIYSHTVVSNSENNRILSVIEQRAR